MCDVVEQYFNCVFSGSRGTCQSYVKDDDRIITEERNTELTVEISFEEFL